MKLFQKREGFVEAYDKIMSETEVSVVETASLDEQLHKDVHSAQEALLAEATRILNTPQPHDTTKSERLRKLYDMGFSRTEDVKEQHELDVKRQEHEDMKTAIQYYTKKYPMYRFINRDTVDAVCKKYGLILTVVRDYISDIPEKNQDEIINFKVWRDDTRYPSELFREQMTFGSTRGYDDEGDDRKMSGRDLLILAPKHKLDLSDKVVEGHIAKLKDPIVLQAVRGFSNGEIHSDDYHYYSNMSKGYLIVSSWGLEASDENVVNGNRN